MEWVQAVIDLGFPVAIALYLLVFQGRQLERFTKAQGEVKIGLYLILHEMGLVEKYEQKLKEAHMAQVATTEE